MNIAMRCTNSLWGTSVGALFAGCTFVGSAVVVATSDNETQTAVGATAVVATLAAMVFFGNRAFAAYKERYTTFDDF